jgi:hypothetical protein
VSAWLASCRQKGDDMITANKKQGPKLSAERQGIYEQQP